MLDETFSSQYFRLLCAQLYNPDLVKHVTLLLDGHDSRISYNNRDIPRPDFWSYKLRKPGLRTQFIIDVNEMVIYVSPSYPARNNTDGKIFEDIALEKILYETDNLCFDGGYVNHVNNIIEKYDEKGFDITLKNFTFPFRKPQNEELSQEQVQFNKDFGGFRSKIKTFFSTFSKMFARFSNINNIKVSQLQSINLQMKLAAVLYNIKTFSEMAKIYHNYVHSKWKEENFDYPCEKDEYILHPSVSMKMNQINDMRKQQDKLLYQWHKKSEKAQLDKEEEKEIHKSKKVYIQPNIVQMHLSMQ